MELSPDIMFRVRNNRHNLFIIRILPLYVFQVQLHSREALIYLENMHTKFDQYPMKTLGEAISNYLHGGQWRADVGQWSKKDITSLLDGRSK